MRLTPFRARCATIWVFAGSVACSDGSVELDPLANPVDGATNTPDAMPSPDATSTNATDDAGTQSGRKTCGMYTSNYECAPDGNSRAKCVDESLIQQSCDRGCLRSDDAMCMGTDAPFSCSGTSGKERAANGDYYITAFGCWVDAAGNKHGDSGDNCIPACLAELQKQGICSGLSGKQCEETITWYTADSARFGCGSKIRITNPKNGTSVVAMAIDLGPNCSVEKRVGKAALDASGRVNRALFGSDQGISDRTLVHVVEVDRSTPLGPVP